MQREARAPTQHSTTQHTHTAAWVALPRSARRRREPARSLWRRGDRDADRPLLSRRRTRHDCGRAPCLRHNARLPAHSASPRQEGRSPSDEGCGCGAGGSGAWPEYGDDFWIWKGGPACRRPPTRLTTHDLRLKTTSTSPPSAPLPSTPRPDPPSRPEPPPPAQRSRRWRCCRSLRGCRSAPPRRPRRTAWTRRS